MAFFARTNAQNAFKFIDDDAGSVWVHISGAPSQGIIGRDASDGQLIVRGGPTADSAYISLYGETEPQTISMEFKPNSNNEPFNFYRSQDSNRVFAIDPANGIYTFFRPSDSTRYLEITSDTNETLVAKLSDLRLKADLDVTITSDNDATTGGVYLWKFSQTGLYQLPATANAGGVNGLIWFDGTDVFVRTGGVTKNMSNIP